MKFISAACVAFIFSLGVYAYALADDVVPVPDADNPLLAGEGALAETPPPAARQGDSVSAESQLDAILKGKAPDIFREKVEDREWARHKQQEMHDSLNNTSSEESE